MLHAAPYEPLHAALVMQYETRAFPLCGMHLSATLHARVNFIIQGLAITYIFHYLTLYLNPKYT